MGDISVWGSGKVGRVNFGLESPLSTLYLALIKGAEPTAFLTGSELAEVTGGSYAREAIPLNGTYWYEGDYGRIICQVDVEFAVATADWGRVRSWALCTAASGGNVMYYGKFKQAKNVQDGDMFRIPAGAIQIRVRPGE